MIGIVMKVNKVSRKYRYFLRIHYVIVRSNIKSEL